MRSELSFDEKNSFIPLRGKSSLPQGGNKQISLLRGESLKGQGEEKLSAKGKKALRGDAAYRLWTGAIQKERLLRSLLRKEVIFRGETGYKGGKKGFEKKKKKILGIRRGRGGGGPRSSSKSPNLRRKKRGRPAMRRISEEKLVPIKKED